LRASHLLRRELAGKPSHDAMSILATRMRRTESNADLIRQLVDAA
jgi:transcription termination factor Rho